ncbi:hypothetical protein HDF25_005085 [Pedobacter cryoconitis]|uniref:Uncharacterized protein n=1 Tax=Pedobacter cryoconitis TaxID=188932 RepID=A0A7X0J881_9SPHI|nr:hypothetical protein [Pedobacter cryoconitis]
MGLSREGLSNYLPNFQNSKIGYQMLLPMMNVDPKTVNSWEIGLRILSKINKLNFSLLLETSELIKNQGYLQEKN